MMKQEQQKIKQSTRHCETQASRREGAVRSRTFQISYPMTTLKPQKAQIKQVP